MTRKDHATRRQILRKLEQELYGTAAHAADQVDRGEANLGNRKREHYEKARGLLHLAHRLCVKVLRWL